ncbi:hypothetical protein FMEAI12_5470006 [Parafrankia sp. Ea1.12]|nr:hypothetical protein FMEAI12_5470006 [Parafrankia sp. Ea1.12]
MTATPTAGAHHEARNRPSQCCPRRTGRRGDDLGAPRRGMRIRLRRRHRPRRVRQRRPAGRAGDGRGGDQPRRARHQRPHRPAAPDGAARQAGREHRPGQRRAAHPRRRRRRARGRLRRLRDPVPQPGRPPGPAARRAARNLERGVGHRPRPGPARRAPAAHRRRRGAGRPARGPARRRLDDDGRHSRPVRRRCGHRAPRLAGGGPTRDAAHHGGLLRRARRGGPELAAGAIGHYYSWLGADLAGWIAGTAATDEDAVARRVEEFTAAGADEIVIAPCSAEISQLERLAGVALRTPAAV